MSEAGNLTRRSLLARGAGVGLSSSVVGRSLLAAQPALAARAGSPGLASRAARRSVPLPSPAQVRADFTTMVEFGPRLTASDPHSRYVDWLEQEFIDAGLQVLPRDKYTTDRWLAEKVGLELVSGPAAGPVKVAAYYPRSQETSPVGISGPLVYGGTAPAPSVNFTSASDLQASLARYPSELTSWAGGLQSILGGGPQGSILLVDLPIPAPATAGALMPDSTFRFWPGHTAADWAAVDYKRLWIEPGLDLPLAPFQELGASAVVFILDASYDALSGGYLPFLQGFQCPRCTSTGTPGALCVSRLRPGPPPG
jgi:hypothetical protein